MLTLDKILEDKKIRRISKEHDFSLLPDLKKSLNLFKIHLDKKNKIGILGDFDTDGITATSSFVIGLKDLFPNTEIFYKLPERNQGHGINKENLLLMKKRGVSLIFTCDNGSNDKEMINYAKKELNIDVIVTDHHQVTVKNFDYCLINCERKDSKYPFPHLCGCGIVYKFLQALEKSNLTKNKLQVNTLKLIRKLTVIATVVDMVHLSDENLYFIENYRALFNDSKGIKQFPFFENLLGLTEYHPQDGKWFGWKVGPLFNGAGRLGKANLLVELIVNQHFIENIFEMIDYYVDLNKYRKELTQQWTSYLDGKIILSKHVNLISHKNIPDGLKRLIANKYLDGKVAFCGSEKEGVVNCSVSNAYGINLISFLQEKEYTTNVGGHTGAFGYSFKKESQEQFITDLNQYIDHKEMKLENNKIYNLSTSELTLDFVKDISGFVWGIGLSEPLFEIEASCQKGMLLAKKHIKLFLELDDGRQIETILWDETNYEQFFSNKKKYKVTLDINRFRGSEKIQFFLVK